MEKQISLTLEELKVLMNTTDINFVIQFEDFEDEGNQPG